MNRLDDFNSLFEAAKREEILVTLSEIENNLGTKPKTKLYQTNQSIIFITMTTLLILFFGWVFTLDQTENIHTNGKVINKEAPQQLAISSNISKHSEDQLFNQKQQEIIIANNEPSNFASPEIDSTTKKVDLPSDSIFQKRIINLKNIHLIELSEEELKALGITVEDKQIKVPIMITESGGLVYSNYNKEGTVTTFKLNEKNSSPIISKGKNFSLGDKVIVEVSDSLNEVFKKDPSKFHIPIAEITDKKADEIKKTFPLHTLVTDDLGQVWRSYQLDDGITEEDITYMRLHHLNPNNYPKAIEGRKRAEAQLIAKLPSYIPILVRSGDVNLPNDKERYRADIILWFEPSEALFNALPQRITKDLKKEYLEVFIEKKPSEQCVYFEACQLVSDRISQLNVFPNPCEQLLNISITLTENTSLEISIYNINGQLIKNIERKQEYQKGLYQFQSDISELKEGLYLLVVQTQNGELLSRRIIKK